MSDVETSSTNEDEEKKIEGEETEKTEEKSDDGKIQVDGDVVNKDTNNVDDNKDDKIKVTAEEHDNNNEDSSFLRTRVGGLPVGRKKKMKEPLLNFDDDEEYNDNEISSNNDTFTSNDGNLENKTRTLPPAQPPAGWNASISQHSSPPLPSGTFTTNNFSNNSLFPNQFTISPMRRSPPRYYGSMYTYTNPTASRYSTLLSSKTKSNDSGSSYTTNNKVDDIEAYQEQRLVSQELAKLRSQVVDLKNEIERQKQKRRDAKVLLNETQDKCYELEKETNRSKVNEHGFKREHSKLKEIAIERRAEIESLQEKLSSLQAELRDTRNHNWTYEKDATTQKRLAEHLSKKLKDVNKKLEDLRNTKQTLLNENETLVDERDNLKTEVENLKEDFARANTVEEELRRNIDGQREKISRLNLEIDSKDGSSSSSNNGGNKDHNGVQEDLERKILGLESEITVLKEQLQRSNEKSLKRKEKASIAKSKLEQVIHDLEVAERERQALLAREASSAHYISEIERQLANYEYQCNVMNDAVQTCQAREQSHAREVARLTEEVRQSKMEASQYKEKMNLSKERLASIEKEKTFLENAFNEESTRYKTLQVNHEKTAKDLEEIKYKYEHYALNQARMVERNDILLENMEKKDFEIAKQKRHLDNALETIQKLQKDLLEKNISPPTQLSQQQPQLVSSPTTPVTQTISNQVITGPPESSGKRKAERGKMNNDKQRTDKITKNALASMKKLKKGKAPQRPITPKQDSSNSSRLAMMKAKLKQELKKQAAASVPKKKQQDFLGLGYKIKKSKEVEEHL
eukprot:g1857.t1